MAHEIDFSTGKAAIFVTGEAAWHRLGTVVAEAQTSEQAIKLAGLDWTVQQCNVAAALPNGQWAPCPSTFANVRTDTGAVLGVVGGFYRPFQNRQAFDFMDSLVGEKLAMFETAGSLKGGRKIWMLARIPAEYRIAGDDVVKPYVLLTNSHDGTSGLRIMPTTVRVVCNNTLNLALRYSTASEGLSIVHTESLEDRVAEARVKFNLITQRLDTFQTEAKALAKRSLNTQQLRDYFTTLVEGRSEKQQKKLLDTIWANFHNPRNAMAGIEGSAWAAYNAVSEFADHQMTVRGKVESEQLDNRVNSIWFGSANTLKQKAWEAAITLVA